MRENEEERDEREKEGRERRGEGKKREEEKRKDKHLNKHVNLKIESFFSNFPKLK